jgi:hypothetical protein
MRLVTGLKGNARNRHVAEFQSMGSTLQAEPTNMLLDRFPHHAAKDAMEVEWRKAGDASQILQRHRFVKVILNVDQDPQNALLIRLLGFASHIGLPASEVAEQS